MNVYFIKMAKAFPEYRDIDIDVLQERLLQVVDVDDIKVEHDQLLDIIFAPDPVIGHPRSDLGIIMSKDANPEVSAYIRDTLAKSIPSSGVADNPDDAILATKTQRQSFESYKRGLFEIINKYKDN